MQGGPRSLAKYFHAIVATASVLRSGRSLESRTRRSLRLFTKPTTDRPYHRQRSVSSPLRKKSRPFALVRRDRAAQKLFFSETSTRVQKKLLFRVPQQLLPILSNSAPRPPPPPPIRPSLRVPPSFRPLRAAARRSLAVPHAPLQFLRVRRLPTQLRDHAANRADYSGARVRQRAVKVEYDYRVFPHYLLTI